MQNKRRWVTMIDVAEAADVSAITVSRVLRQPGKVRHETRERVQAAISALGYVPDEAAGTLSSRRSRIVGALISTLAGSVFASTVDGLSHGLRAAGFQLLLANTDYTPEFEAQSISTLLGRRPDGLVLTSTAHTEAAERLLKTSGIPIVEVWELPERPLDCAVGFSNHVAGRAMTEFLAETGRKRIGFIGSNRSHGTRGRSRARGYAEALEALALGPPRLVEVDGDALDRGPEAGACGLGELMARWPDTDAVFCVSDQVALGALCEARRRGLSVPDAIAIVGFGDFDLAGDAGLALTTVRVPGFSIGEKAATLIVDRSLGNSSRSAIVDVGFEIIRRATA